MHRIITLFVTLYSLPRLLCSADGLRRYTISLAEIASNQGVVKSPNYPNLYPNNFQCTWKITVKETFTIRLEFTAFQLEIKRNGVCKDKLQVYDGEDETSREIVSSCGGNLRQKEVLSSGNKLLLKLTTNGSIRRKGFLAKFTSLPGPSEIITGATKTTTISTVTTTTTTTEEFNLTRTLLGDAQTTYPLIITADHTNEAEPVNEATAFPSRAFSYSTEPNTNFALVTKLENIFSTASATPFPVLTSTSLRSDTSVAFNGTVPALLLLLCLLAIGVFVIMKKGSKKILFSSTTNHFYHGATSNPGANITEQHEIFGMVGCDRNERFCSSSLSDIVTMKRTNDRKGEYETSVADEGDIMNIIYESYDGEETEVVNVREKDSGIGKSDTIYHIIDDSRIMNGVYDKICQESEEGFELNIIYEPYDEDGNT